MFDEASETRATDWKESLPIVRLFHAGARARSFWAPLLALAAVMIVYVAGRALDAIWVGVGHGALVSSTGAAETEIDAYAAYDAQSYAAWKERARAVLDSSEDGVDRAALRKDVGELLDAIDVRRTAALAALKAKENSQARQRVPRDADRLRIALAVGGPSAANERGEVLAAARRLFAADPKFDTAARADLITRTADALDRRAKLDRENAARPRGPFDALLRHELQWTTAAIHAVCAGDIGLVAGDGSARPALLGSVLTGLRGVFWIVTQRPCYALLLGLIALCTFAYFGGAICRYLAVQEARDEQIPVEAALSFSREKFPSLVAAPTETLAAFLVALVLMLLGGIPSAIPVLGEVISGLLFFLALLGGVAMVFLLLAAVLGFPLMWPTIAVEGSDAFDAIQRSAGYVFQRPWHAGFYSFVAVVYGAIWIVVVRMILMLVLKATHVTIGGGMSLFGLLSSAHTDTIGKLDAMWRMPAWQDLPLLPALSSPPFYGEFFNAPLSGSETLAAYLVLVWIFMVVGLLAAFAVSFYFSASTQIYFLLRRSVDAVDFDEIYYEEPPDEFAADEESADSDTADAGGDAADSSDSGTRRPQGADAAKTDRAEDSDTAPTDDKSGSSGDDD